MTTASTSDDSTPEINPLLIDPAPAELPRLSLPTAHHFAVVRRAVEDRAETLKKLAGKADDEGYPREGRIILGDAQALTEDILPQLDRQAELEFELEELPNAIRLRLQSIVFKHVLATEDEGEADHRAELLDALGDRISRYVQAVAKRAFSAGYRARQDEPNAFAYRALDEL